MLPPPLADTVQAPLMLQGLIGGAITAMNRDAAPEGATGDPSALSEAQTAFPDSIVAVWPAFLQNPGLLVLETGFAPGDDRFVDVMRYGDDPRLAFGELRPIVGTAPAPARAALSAAMLSRAIGDGAAENKRASRADAAGQAAWAKAEQVAADLAMQAWLGQDLPARFGGQ